MPLASVGVCTSAHIPTLRLTSWDSSSESRSFLRLQWEYPTMSLPLPQTLLHLVQIQIKTNFFRVRTDCQLSMPTIHIWVKNLPKSCSPISCVPAAQGDTAGDSDRHSSRGPCISADSDRVSDTTAAFIRTKAEDGRWGLTNSYW